VEHPVTPDQLILNSDGTIRVVWSPAPIDPDRPKDGTFQPAWDLPRPSMRLLRLSQETFIRLGEEQRARITEVREAERTFRERDAAGEATDEEATTLADISRAIARSTEQVMWEWWTLLDESLAVRVGAPWPRTPTADDAPPWLLRNTTVYEKINEHWTKVPLVLGTSLDGLAATPPATPTPANGGGQAPSLLQLRPAPGS
jgi:hypothetical protein